MLDERDIEGLAAEIVGGAQEAFVAGLTGALVDGLASGIANATTLSTLSALAAENRSRVQTLLMEHRGRIAETAYAACLRTLEEADARDARAIAAFRHASPAAATAHARMMAEQAAIGIREMVERQNVALAAQAERAWYEVAAEGIRYSEAGAMPRGWLDKAVLRLAKAGVETVDYKSGISNQVDVAIKRHMRTQMNQAAGRMELDRLDACGHRFVQTTAHFGAREDHEPWQGRAFCLDGARTVDGVEYPDFYSATGYGTVTGLCGANCRHHFGVHIPGLSKLPELPDEVRGMGAEEYYAATQRQRELERRVRKSKREVAALERAGIGLESPTYVQKRLVLGRRQAALREHCAETGLARQAARERAYGVGEQPRALTSPGWRARIRASEAFVPKAGGKANAYTVAYKAVNSKAYHDKFEAMPYPKPVRESAYRQAGRILRDRDGTDGERMAVVNARTGEVVADTFAYDVERGQVNLLPADAKKAAECPDGVLVLHNHPGSSYPSAQDILSAARNVSVKGSVVACHDGTVYLIEADDPTVVAEYWKLYNGLKDAAPDRATLSKLALSKLEAKNGGSKWYTISRL